ncbi:MAG: ATP-binding cassette domain-containing protein, partial [Bacteroidia bacterium]|nr:ATP-binding cassette domain-containing protein [Bacteroidia bacterium]
LYLIIRFTGPQGLRTSLIESNQKYEVAHWLEELARVIETFKLAGVTSLPMEKTDKVVSEYLTSRQNHFKTLMLQYVNLVAFKVIIAAGLLLIGGLLVINQQMNIGQFVASEIIIILILSSVEKLILSMETIYDVLAAIEKIGTVADIPLDPQEGTKLSENQMTGIAIEIQEFSYRFKDSSEDIINNINLNINSGEKICLAGYNGAGKSLLLQLIAGLYDDYRGSISYNGISHHNCDNADLRSLIGDNLSKEDIFSGTLKDNITLGRSNISTQEMIDAISVVGLTDFVRNLKRGFDEMLIPEGKNLPTSVCVKIKLARSIVGQPKLILIGKSLNELSLKDKKRFLKYVLKKEWTVVTLTNDPVLAELFDKVVIMKKGEIIANSTIHDHKDKEYYSEIFDR